MKTRSAVLTFSAVLCACGMALIVVAQCAIVSVNNKGIVMGYSSGKELFEGNCQNKLTFLECATCCGMYGLPQNEVDICIDLCLDKFGASSAVQEILNAAKTIDTRDTRDYVKYNRSKVLIRAAARSERYPRIRKMGLTLCRDLELNAVES